MDRSPESHERRPLGAVRRFLADEQCRVLSDDALWARFRDRADMDALGVLLERARGRLTARGHHLTGDAALAEDAVHNAFLTLVKHREKYGTYDRAEVVLNLLTASSALMLLRQRWRATRRDKRAARPEVVTDYPPADSAALDAAVAGLPARERQAVELVFLAGLTHEATAYVKGLYRTVLGRDADAGGLAFWVGLLAAGRPPQEIAQRIWTSAEHRGNQVDGYYLTYLGRPSDPGGRAYWVGLMFSGVLDEAGVSRDILLSGEAQARGGSTAGYVRLLYTTVLGREADAGGLAFWTSMLDSGTLTRAQVVTGIVRSGESHDRMVRSFYRAYLRRPVSDGEVFGWRSLLDSGVLAPGQAAVGFLASGEFLAGAAAAVG